MTAGGRRERLILTAVSGTACDDRALDIALMMVTRAYHDIAAVYVVVVPHDLPLEAEWPDEVARGEAVLRAAEDYAHAHGREIEVEVLQARAAGPAIVDEAVLRGASMIIMATSLFRRAGEVTIGRTTVPYVLKNAPCEVLVCRHPAIVK